MDQFCRSCGNPLDPAGRCPVCGRPAAPQPAPEQKKNTTLLLILGVVLLAVVLIVVLLLCFGGGNPTQAGSVGSVSTAEDPELEPLVRPEDEEFLSSYGSITGRENAASVVLLTEAEAVQAYAARGFTGVTITTCYSMNGDFLERREISAAGTDKHPYYEAGYEAPDGTPWTVTLAGDAFIAMPLSYNLEGDWDALHMVSEAGTLRAYGSQTNTFYTITPDASALVVKQVDRIDAETLNALTAWEVDAP